MRKSILSLTAVCLLWSLFPTELKASVQPVKTSMVAEKPEEELSAEELIARLNEIKAKSKSGLSKEEKREMRDEVRSIKAQMRSSNNGIYLSTGAAIIIVLLLIILL